MSAPSPALLTSQEVQSIRDGAFELRSMKMRVFNAATEYAGPGLVRSDAKGHYSVLMFSGRVVDPSAFLEELNRESEVVPGQLIPDSQKYQLELTDTTERVWTSNNLRIDTYGTTRGTFVSGHVFELVCKTKNRHKINRCSLALDYPGDYRIPFNARTDTVRIVNGRKSRSSKLNVLATKIGPAKVELIADPGILRVSASVHPARLTNDIETRLTEAVQFGIARPLYWSLLTKQTPTELLICLRSGQVGSPSIRTQPPLEISQPTIESFCTLLNAYFRYISRHEPVDRLHPLSASMRSIMHASSGAIEAEALALCTAVEGALSYIKKPSAKLTARDRKWIKDARATLVDRKGPADLVKRFHGLIGMLEQPSAKHRLQRLVQVNAVALHQVAAWDHLRNRLAHGETVSTKDLQKLIDRVDCVLALYYRLVFRIIGYKGPYTDYSSLGWPLVQQ